MEIEQALLPVRKRRGPLWELRKRYPKQKWKAERNGFGWGYKNCLGYNAHWVSALAPSYPDDDDTFVSQFYIYRNRGLNPIRIHL